MPFTFNAIFYRAASSKNFKPAHLLSGSALDAPLLAYFLANALSTIFAIDPRISLEFLWRLGVHVWLFYVIVGLFARRHGRDVFEALYLSSAVVILIRVFEFASWYFGLSWVLPFQQGWPATTVPVPVAQSLSSPRRYRIFSATCAGQRHLDIFEWHGITR